MGPLIPGKTTVQKDTQRTFTWGAVYLRGPHDYSPTFPRVLVLELRRGLWETLSERRPLDSAEGPLTECSLTLRVSPSTGVPIATERAGVSVAQVRRGYGNRMLILLGILMLVSIVGIVYFLQWYQINLEYKNREKWLTEFYRLHAPTVLYIHTFH